MENETSGLLAIKFDVNHSYVAPEIPNESFSLRRSTIVCGSFCGRLKWRIKVLFLRNCQFEETLLISLLL